MNSVSLKSLQSLNSCIISDMIDVITETTSPLFLSATFLDAERSGESLIYLGKCILSASKQITDPQFSDISTEIENYLSEQGCPLDLLPKTHLTDFFKSAIIKSLDDPDIDILSWLDSFFSLNREGFTLFWLSQMTASKKNVDWKSVIYKAENIISSRTQGGNVSAE